MGMIFPFYALLFARFDSAASLALFSAGCLVAGLTVGLVSYLIGEHLLLAWIELRSQGLGELGREGAVLDLESSQELGEISANFTRFFAVLDDELRLIRTGSALSAESLASLRASLADTSGTLGRLADESRSGEAALDGLTGKVRDSVAKGLELSESGTRLGILLDGEERLFTELSEYGRKVDITRDGLSRMIQSEYGRSQKMRSMVARGEQAFDELRKLQQRIGSVLDVLLGVVGTMEEMAARSNLLSINASIEATRAGQSGNGFAVVAGEMRNQADGSARHAGDLKANLTALSRDIKGGEESIHEALDVFGILKTGTEAGGEALRGMASHADELEAAGTSLQERVAASRNTFDRLRTLTTSLSEAGAAFSSLGSNSETDRARQTLYGMLLDVSSLMEGQAKLNELVGRLAESVTGVDLLVAHFKLLDADRPRVSHQVSKRGGEAGLST